MSILEKLGQNVVDVDRRKESARLVAKWEETGLLEGLTDERARANMSLLLENQTKQLLKESSSMQAGDVEGFASVAFPIVRRVFGGLVANNLVSVQPMSLPNGLIFFLDFTHNSTRLGQSAGDSVYGGGVVGKDLASSGVVLTGASAEKGFYNLNNGYSSPTGSVVTSPVVRASGTVGGAGSLDWSGTPAYVTLGDGLVRYDPDLASGTAVAVATLPKAALSNFDVKNYVALTLSPGSGQQARRLTVDDPVDSANVLVVLAASSGEDANALATALGASQTVTFPINDARTSGGALGSVVGTTPWGLENNPFIPEIDIRVDSIDIQADTKKLKAKWTPELQQDIAAYQNMDAEVELTAILSETIALELDQEILEDLVKGARAGVYHWSRRPGRFLVRDTGAPISNSSNEAILGADFTGNVSEWYETLLETVNDLSAQIHRKVLRGGATFVVVGPEMANLLEFTAGFRASVSHDDESGEAGAVKVGQLNKKWDVYVDPYFLRNVILVGRKGGSFLESGYVYAPYVPLQVTPTVFGTEDFVPRKAVMTRYGKKMVRPDFYGLVVVHDLVG